MGEERDQRRGKWWLGTDLLSLLCSFFSRTFSHFLSRKRFRRGEALGVEHLDQDDGPSSSLDGVISMEGSCRYSLEPERLRAEWRPATASRSLSPSFSLATFLIRRILKRLRRSVGVEELECTQPSDTAGPPPSEYTGPSFGTLTWREGGLRVSPMVLSDSPARNKTAGVAPG